MAKTIRIQIPNKLAKLHKTSRAIQKSYIIQFTAAPHQIKVLTTFNFQPLSYSKIAITTQVIYITISVISWKWKIQIDLRTTEIRSHYVEFYTWKSHQNVVNKSHSFFHLLRLLFCCDDSRFTRLFRGGGDWERNRQKLYLQELKSSLIKRNSRIESGDRS